MARKTQKTNKTTEWKSRYAKAGEYYKIQLTRGHGEGFEFTEIGVGFQGQVVSYYYGSRCFNSNIQQYNGMDAEAMARQMIFGLDADSKWEEA